jgi:dCTP deaminase
MKENDRTSTLSESMQKNPPPDVPGSPRIPAEAPPEVFSTGILPSQELEHMAFTSGEIRAAVPILEDQIQPASMDLRLGPVAYRVRASFLPGRLRTVQSKLDELAMHTMDISAGGVLERGCVYVVPLLESVSLRHRISARANPKSSTGRLDIFTRLITDYATEFDSVREQYKGPLYAEISPRTFSVLVRQGSRLNQLRIQRGTPARSDKAIRELQNQFQLVGAAPDAGEIDIRDASVPVSVDLRGAASGGIVGYKAKSHTGLIDVDRVRGYDIADFWEPIAAPSGSGLILDPEDFYILASQEAVHVPPGYAAEMTPYDNLVGEFRVHYAGFFDPGFGHAAAGGEGARAVLEVRSYEVPFVIEHGQIVGRLEYQRLTAIPQRLYGMSGKSNYQRQGLALSKHFRPPPC